MMTMLRVARFLSILFVAIVLLFAVVFFVLTDSLQADGATHLPEKSLERLLDCIYFSIITITTLGYGDISPVGWGKLFAAIETISGVLFAGLAVSQISNAHHNEKVAQRVVEKLRTPFHRVFVCMLGMTNHCQNVVFPEDGMTQEGAKQFLLNVRDLRDGIQNTSDDFQDNALHSVLIDSPAQSVIHQLILLQYSFRVNLDPIESILEQFATRGVAIGPAAMLTGTYQIDPTADDGGYGQVINKTNELLTDVIGSIERVIASAKRIDLIVP